MQFIIPWIEDALVFNAALEGWECQLDKYKKPMIHVKLALFWLYLCSRNLRKAKLVHQDTILKHKKQEWSTMKKKSVIQQERLWKS